MWVKNRVAGCAIAYEGAPMPVFENLQPPQLPPGFKGQALRLLEAHKNSRWHWYCHAAMNGAPKMQAVWVIAYPFTFWRVELHYAILVIPK